MRKINKFVAIAILATIATFNAPQAFAGVVMGDNSSSVTGVVMGDFTGVVMGDFTGIIITDLTQALTGVVMGD
jgi:hypothetical protein